MFSITLALGVMGYIFTGADFVPNNATFDKVTTKALIVDGGDAYITLQAKGTDASIALMSAEHVGGNFMMHQATCFAVTRDASSMVMCSTGHALIASSEEAATKLEAAKKEGFAVVVSPEHAMLTLHRNGKPFIGLG